MSGIVRVIRALRSLRRRKHVQEAPRTVMLSTCPMGMCGSKPFGSDGCGLCIGPPKRPPPGWPVSDDGKWLLAYDSPAGLQEATKALAAQRRKETKQ